MTASLTWLVRHIEELVCSLAFAAIVVAVSANVVLRFLTGASLVATEEIAYLGFVYSVFFAVTILYRRGAMIAVDFLVEYLPQRVKYAVNLFNCVVLVVATAYFTYLSYKLAAGGWIRRTAFLDIPYFYVNLAPTLSFALMTLYSLYFLFRLLSGRDIEQANLEDKM